MTRRWRYKPRLIEIMEADSGNVELLKGQSTITLSYDADGTNPGDYLTCPTHPDEIVYVEGGGNLWEAMGVKGSFGWNWLVLRDRGWCHRCLQLFKIVAGSYGG